MPPTAPQLSAESYLRSTLLTQAGFRHAFLTRQGGYSQGVFSSLNFAWGTGDPDENVHANLALVGRLLDVRADQIYFLSQVHGTEYELADHTQLQDAFRQRQGDIVLSHDPAAAAAIRTADCVPVLLACKRTGWVAACHSGWQGCVRGAAPRAVAALVKQGASDLIAAIGPHISSLAFEVGADVAKQLLDASPDKSIVSTTYDKPHVDLRRMVRAQLVRAGLAPESIDDVPGCTVLEPERFFSFRRDKNPSGRMLSLIVPQSV